MQVKDIMKTKVVVVRLDMGFEEVAQTLLDNKVSGAPVINDEGLVVGVLSEKDLFRAIYPSYQEFYDNPHAFFDFKKMETEAQSTATKTVEEFMSRRLITTTPDTHILKIGGLMIATGIHRVPVVDPNNKLLGMVSRRDIYRAILREHFDLWEE